MKITLNLLPKKRKDRIRSRKIMRLVVWLEIMAILASIFVVGISFGISQILDLKIESIDKQISMDSSEGNYAEIKKYEEVLDKTRKEIGVIDNIQKNELDWISVFRKINESVPDGIMIGLIENEDYKLFISGISDNRDLLVRMKDSLEKSGCFSDVSIPLDDIVLKNDIDFRLELKLKEDCLRPYEKK